MPSSASANVAFPPKGDKSPGVWQELCRFAELLLAAGRSGNSRATTFPLDAAVFAVGASQPKREDARPSLTRYRM